MARAAGLCRVPTACGGSTPRTPSEIRRADASFHTSSCSVKTDGGSLIVAEFTDLAAAQAWADADPFVAAGVYRDVSVRPFRKTLP